MSRLNPKAFAENDFVTLPPDEYDKSVEMKYMASIAPPDRPFMLAVPTDYKGCMDFEYYYFRENPFPPDTPCELSDRGIGSACLFKLKHKILRFYRPEWFVSSEKLCKCRGFACCDGEVFMVYYEGADKYFDIEEEVYSEEE